MKFHFTLILSFLHLFSSITKAQITYLKPEGAYIKASVISDSLIEIYFGYDCHDYRTLSSGIKHQDTSYLHFGFFVGSLNNRKSNFYDLTFPKHRFTEDLSPRCDGHAIFGNPDVDTSKYPYRSKGLFRFSFFDTLNIYKDKRLDSFIRNLNNDPITFYSYYDKVGIPNIQNFNLQYIYSGLYCEASVYFKNLSHCQNKYNHSPKMTNYTNNFHNLGLFTLAPNLEDVENDFPVFKLEAPYQSVLNNFLSFQSGYSLSAPIKTYVGIWGKDGFGKNNKYSNPPRGFNFDTLTGEMVFYKFDSSELLLYFAIYERRLDTAKNWRIISKSTFYFKINIKNTSNNNIPIIETKDYLEVIAGDTLKSPVYIFDSDVSNHTQVRFNPSQNNLKLLPVSLDSNKKEYELNWITDSSHTIKPYYSIIIDAIDNYCYSPGYFQKAVKIHVLPRVEYENISRDTTCNRLFLEVKHDPVPGRVIYEWDIKSQSGNYQWKLNANTPYGNRFLTQSLPNDTYYITSLIRHDSLGFRPQTDTVILNAKPEVLFVGDTSFCKNTSLAFKLDTLNLTNLSKISMLSSSGSIKKSGLTAELSGADSLVHLWFEVTDSVGCIAKDSIWVFERPQEERVWAAIPTGCYTGSLVYLNPLWSDFEKRKTTINNTDNWVVWKDSNVYLDPQKVPLADFIDGIQTKSLFLSYNDSWNCRQHDTVQWLVAQPVEVQLLDTVVCQNQSIIDLNDLVQKPNLDGSGYQPTWSLTQWPSTVNQNGVWANNHSLYMGSQTDKTREGIYKFAVSFKKYAGGCVQSDTVQIQVINEPQLQFASTTTLCRYTKELNLLKSVWVNSQPASTGRFSWDSYNWNKTASEIGYYSIINGTTAPADLAAGNWRVRYEGPTNGCMDTGFFTLRVFHSPVAKIDLSTNPNLNIHAAQMTATHSSFIDDNSALTWLWDAGDTTTTSDTSSKAVFQYTYPKIVGNYPLTLIVNSEKGCKDTTGTNIELTDNAGLNKLRSSNVYHIQSNGEVTITSPEWQLESIQWYDLKGAEIRKPKEGINIYQIVLKRGKERFVDSGKWVKRSF